MRFDAPRWDPKKPIAPFSKPSGDLMHYPYGEVEWRHVPPFHTVLRLESWARGRSAAYFIWKDMATGCKYPMFMADLAEVIKGVDIQMGSTEPVLWAVKKRGQNYGIGLA